MPTIVHNGVTIDVDQQLQEIERVRCERSLATFLTKAWRYIDPAPFEIGMPIEAVAEHLQAVADGEIRNLIINIPPRCCKSSLTSVAFPAWVWAQPVDEKNPSQTSGPGVQFLTGSYAFNLATRDAVKSRRLITSPWYQKHWGKRFRLTSDQNTKVRYDNDKGGYRLITSVEAQVTGEGGNIIIIDDPNAAQEAFSEATIQTTIDWWDNAMSTRLNDARTGAYVVIQQRLSEEDLTGHILSKDMGNWTHLCLPMRFEKERSFITSIGWEDPRTEEGQLLWEERFGEKEVKELEGKLGGPWAVAGQLQQRPEPKGGGVIKREWWKLWEAPQYPPMDFIVAFLDSAYTEKAENDPSAMTVFGVYSGDIVARNEKLGRIGTERSYSPSSPRAMMMYAWSKRLELHQLVQEVAQTCKMMKVDKLLIENKAAGHSVAQELRRLFAHEDFMVQLIDPKSQDKLSRLYSIQHLFAEGMISAPDKTWAEMTITQVGTFPKGKHDDLVDCVSGCLRHLRDLGLLARGPEITAELQEAMQYQGPAPKPLYEC